MSDKEEELTLNEEQESVESQTLSKEERLEAARKKFEELKKKKKKKKSKKSKEKSEEPTSETENTDAVDKSKEGTPIEIDAENEKNDIQLVDSKKDDIQQESKSVPENKNDETEVVTDAVKEPEVVKGLEVVENKDVESEKISEPQEDMLAPNDSESASVSGKAEGIPKETGNIKETEPKISNEEIKSLKNTIAQQENTIKKLRDENTDLKLEKLDLNDKITELEQKIAQLSASSHSVPAAQSPVAIKKAEQVFTKNDYASQSQPSFDNLTEDFRESLMVWKGWQVDMTEWNGIVSAPKLAF